MELEEQRPFMVSSGLTLLPCKGVESWFIVRNPGNWKKHLGFVLASSTKGDCHVTTCMTPELPGLLRALPTVSSHGKVVLPRPP